MTPRKQRTARSVCGVTCALAIMAIAVPATAQNTRHNAAVAHAPTAAQPPPSQQSSSTFDEVEDVRVVIVFDLG